MKIYSPSYKRSEGVKTHLLIPEVIYCVHSFEIEKYQAKGYNVQELPDSTKSNIARVRNYIKENFIKNKGIIIDDDIEGIKRWTTKNNYPKLIDADIPEFLESGFILCEEIGARLWGVNILGDKGSYREYSPFSLTNTVSGSFMGFLNNELRFDERIPLKEDYDFCLQNFNEYRKVLRFNHTHLIKKDHGNKGGCADYRTVKKEKEQMAIFQKKWGSKIVKVDAVNQGKKTKVYDINPVIYNPIKGI